MLALLMRMRQACDHPSLLSKKFKEDIGAIDPTPDSKFGEDDEDEDKEDKEDIDKLTEAFMEVGLVEESKCETCLTILPLGWKSERCKECLDTVFSRQNSIAAPHNEKRRTDEGRDTDLPYMSAKIREMLRVLRSIHSRTMGLRDEDGKKLVPEKTIIFSQFVTMLDVVGKVLAYEGIRYTRIDGSMKPPERKETLDKIRKDTRCRVILISFKAVASAFDRAHRLGQTKEVNIYKLTVPGTVEDRMLDLQSQKRALAHAVLSGGKFSGIGLSLEDLMMLFGRKRGPVNRGQH